MDKQNAAYVHEQWTIIMQKRNKKLMYTTTWMQLKNYAKWETSNIQEHVLYGSI